MAFILGTILAAHDKVVSLVSARMLLLIIVVASVITGIPPVLRDVLVGFDG